MNIAATTAPAWLSYLPAFSAVVAALAFVVSVFKNRQDVARSREISARSAWEDYLKMAFENPRLARGAVAGGDADDFEKYEWFVSRMLYAAEEVLTLTSQSKPWNEAIKDQVGFHAEYLREQGQQYVDHYSEPLQALINEELGNA